MEATAQHSLPVKISGGSLTFVHWLYMKFDSRTMAIRFLGFLRTFNLFVDDSPQRHEAWRVRVRFREHEDLTGTDVVTRANDLGPTANLSLFDATFFDVALGRRHSFPIGFTDEHVALAYTAVTVLAQIRNWTTERFSRFLTAKLPSAAGMVLP
ncbi:hypothetical protein HDU88_001159 [Geranomyces variabilis]|nr:hypothetical protein HDU88_001159 [Geranomyces variabilis]